MGRPSAARQRRRVHPDLRRARRGAKRWPALRRVRLLRALGVELLRRRDDTRHVEPRWQRVARLQGLLPASAGAARSDSAGHPRSAHGAAHTRRPRGPQRGRAGAPAAPAAGAAHGSRRLHLRRGCLLRRPTRQVPRRRAPAGLHHPALVLRDAGRLCEQPHKGRAGADAVLPQSHGRARRRTAMVPRRRAVSRPARAALHGHGTAIIVAGIVYFQRTERRFADLI